SAELGSTIAPEWELSRRLAEARPFELPSLDAAGDTHLRVDSAEDGAADFELQFELGRAELSSEEADALREGAVVALDKLAGDPVDIVMDGRLIARGEVLVLDDKFCVRVSEILALPCADPSAELVH
ncbi:MAG TPA: FliM/FliN family flagellar motor switch protein, partial [Planctomycetaceae bacterium]|nr:FliM/FliN family flagellar motor switch protein [Planctomycetaceae bacterium]